MTHVLRPESRNRVVALLMAVGLLGAILATTTPQKAEAYCVDVNYSVGRSLPYAYEASQSSGTCDDELDYYGKVSDTLQDGYRVRAAFTVAGVWNYSGYECQLDDWTPYAYWDDDGHSWMKICKNNGGGCSAYWTNQGF